MEIFVFGIAWIAGSFVSFLAFAQSWKRKFGCITVGDAVFFASLSLWGPISFLAAAIIWLLDMPKPSFWDRRIW